jgi:serine/threonine protein kinase
MEDLTPERYRQIRNLFEAVVERPADARAAFLEEACAGDRELPAEIEALMAAQREQAGILAEPVLTWNPQRLEGRQIGPYEILREIGKGGMGTVYLAARADRAFHKQVALKVVRPEGGGEEVLGRFQQEREILATLDHPNIARLLDGGATAEGLPYFVMEYVAGDPIDTYCDRNQLNVAKRLELFRTVCGAVAYAHRNGIVHRDLKPANILVTAEGTVKLLDFGIAKILRPLEDQTVYMTRSGLHLMTPEYASPEQVRGEMITAATDVYSLGTILYELLTGHQPYRMRSRVFHEVVRVICEESPTRPSTAVGLPGEVEGPDRKPITVTPEIVGRLRDASPAELRRQLAGDLDNILLKSLSKEPLARYRSAGQFSEDVQRHLAQQPVLARGHTFVYGIGKLLQRYRVWVIAGVALAAALATGVVTVRPIGVLYVAGTLVTIGLWYAATDNEMGRRIAESSLLFPTFALVFGAAIIFAVLRAPDLRSIPAGALAVLFWGEVAIGIAIASTRYAGWLARKRWAGRLLLELSVWRMSYVAYFGMAMAAYYTLGLICGWFSFQPSDPAWFRFTLPITFYFWPLQGQLEIREQGIIRNGKLLRWGNIESYEWASSRLAPLFLKIRLRRLLKALPPVEIKVSPKQHPAVDALLCRYLSDWPTAGERVLETPEEPVTPEEEEWEPAAESAQSQLRDRRSVQLQQPWLFRRATIKYYEQALFACDLNDPQAVSGALADLGVAHAESGEHDEAVALFTKSLGLQPEAIDRAKTLWNMSLSLDQLGQRENAIAIAEEALAILVEGKSPDATMVQEQLEEWRKNGGS